MKNSPKNITEYFKMLYYLRGSEMEHNNIVQKKSDDPYFNDAYIGIKDIDIKERNSITDSLNSKLEGRIRKGRPVLLPILKLAAGLAILVSIGIWFINNSNKSKPVVFQPNISVEENTSERKVVATMEAENKPTDINSIQIEKSKDSQASVLNKAENKIANSAANSSTPQVNNQDPGFSNILEPYDPLADSDVMPESEDDDDFYYQPGTKIEIRQFPIAKRNDQGNADLAVTTIDDKSSESFSDIKEGMKMEDLSTTDSYDKDQSNEVVVSEKIAASSSIAKKSKSKVNSEVLGQASGFTPAQTDNAEREQIIEMLDSSASEDFQIIGTVLNMNNEALVGAKVRVPNTTKRSITAADGSFSIDLNGDDRILNISHFGYEDQKVKFKKGDNLTVVLESDQNESAEGSIISQEDESEISAGRNSSNQNFQFAKPRGGWKSYKSYIAKRLRYPSDALLNKVEGRVIVSFYVNKDGVLSDFRVEKGLGFGCDEEAIRLLKGGPKWTAGSTETRSEYTFRFN